MRDLYIKKKNNVVRMSDHVFCFLLKHLEPLISKQDTRLRKPFSAKERFIITVRFLATGNSLEDPNYLAKVLPHVISQIVVEVCAALISILVDQIHVCMYLYKYNE